MATYKQPEKETARQLLIRAAVEYLTIERQSTFIVSPEKFEKIYDHFKSLFFGFLRDGDINTKNQLSWLLLGKKRNWLEFSQGYRQPKSPSTLKVLYLSGPEPLNDLQVFLDLGISLSNIWAVESEKSEYARALEDLKHSGIQIKLHRGNLAEFFELTNHTFDIIYLDACTPIISNNYNPLETLKQIFTNRRLSDLSVLITNFSEPKESDKWAKYLAPWYVGSNEFAAPGADIAYGKDALTKATEFDEYARHVQEHIPEYYSHFLTQFIPVLSAEIIPMWQAFSLSAVQNNHLLNEGALFKMIADIREQKPNGNSMNDLVRTIQHYLLAVDSYPLLNWSRLSIEHNPNNSPITRFLKSHRRKLTLEDALFIGALLKNIEETPSGFNTRILDICSPALRECISKLDFFDRRLRLTCDVPMKNLFIELLVGLYGFPYIANVERCSALTYKAKDTVMYSNLFTFDQCRYLYDFLPTVDLFEAFFDHLPNQFVVRACIDTIHRNHVELNPQLFKWGFIEGLYGEFGAIHLEDRISVI